MLVEPRTMIANLVVCETVAAIAKHLRDTTYKAVSLSGHATPRPAALCGALIAWDTTLPIFAATCSSCIDFALTLPVNSSYRTDRRA